jgi:hypothetical protein
LLHAHGGRGSADFLQGFERFKIVRPRLWYFLDTVICCGKFLATWVKYLKGR